MNEQLCCLCNRRDLNSARTCVCIHTYSLLPSGTTLIACCLEVGQKHQRPKWSLCQLRRIGHNPKPQTHTQERHKRIRSLYVIEFRAHRTSAYKVCTANFEGYDLGVFGRLRVTTITKQCLKRLPAISMMHEQMF